MTAQPASTAEFFKVIEDKKNGLWGFSSVATLTYTKNIYKILSLGLSKKDSTRK